MGPTASVTTTGAQRLVGAGSAGLGLGAAGPQLLRVGLCYEPSGGGCADELRALAVRDRAGLRRPEQYGAAAVGAPGAGTWNVGMCVLNPGASALVDNGESSGWVYVAD